jgi:hypothetical protein
MEVKKEVKSVNTSPKFNDTQYTSIIPCKENHLNPVPRQIPIFVTTKASSFVPEDQRK